jgi:hypothetical protein
MGTSEIRAIEMVRSIRDELYRETKQLSAEGLTAFIAREASKATQKQGASPPAGAPLPDRTRGCVTTLSAESASYLRLAPAVATTHMR